MNAPEYAELQVTTNFSFLRGASHPHELVVQAAALGYRALGITDRNSLAGIVRAHTSAKEVGLRALVGTRLQLRSGESPYDHFELLVYPNNRDAYGKLCKLLTEGNLRTVKGECFLELADYLPLQKNFSTIVVPPFFQTRHHNLQFSRFFELCKALRDNRENRELLSIAVTYNYSPSSQRYFKDTVGIASALGIPLVATNDVHYHIAARRPLQDLLTCIRLGTTVQQAGYALFQNGERYLKTIRELHRLFRECPRAVTRTLEIAEMAEGFSLDSLSYEYPEEICPADKPPQAYLEELTWREAGIRYSSGIPAKTRELLEQELALIEELDYAKYFLTCYDIVRFARSQDILCQGRGAAANSAVCFCLGITSVDPSKIELLFARFISKERREPPDIDIDFEHERREEVIQYIYEKYGRAHAGLTCEVVTYRARSAVREAGKALGLSLDIVDKLAKSIHRWTGCLITPETIKSMGLDPFDSTIQTTLLLTHELIGFPRHLSQHVGGFIISKHPLNETVPILNAAMENRTIIEWDKNDIEELGMLKIDVLGLGMLTCIRKALELVNARRDTPLTLASIPPDDPAVYDMLCEADSVGVFQVESRAQMSMLPRLRPRCYYDLVIQVAIVRPGPIQGNMVHPYLRRRSGKERISFPDERVKNILGKTLGVPLFQEQAMKLAIVLARFSPGEAEKLRRAMAAWKSHHGVIAAFHQKIVQGFLENGYSKEFAETCFSQMRGFSEYGFPESHAASFALLVYASSWIKKHYPGEFYCALLNSQPMGFYTPSQIVQDASRHGITILPTDIYESAWDCTLHEDGSHLRLGLRLIRGLPEADAGKLHARATTLDSRSILLLRMENDSRRSSLERLGNADALGASRRDSLWGVASLPRKAAPLDALFRSRETTVRLPQLTLEEEMIYDYASTGLSLKAHPLQFAREILKQQGVCDALSLAPRFGLKVGSLVSVAGLSAIRQRPGTANGVVFITLEDETGNVNLIIKPKLFEEQQKAILTSTALGARGKLQRIGPVVYVEAEAIWSIDDVRAEFRSLDHTVVNYSY